VAVIVTEMSVSAVDMPLMIKFTLLFSPSSYTLNHFQKSFESVKRIREIKYSITSSTPVAMFLWMRK
jgi:hypothetical protein